MSENAKTSIGALEQTTRLKFEAALGIVRRLREAGFAAYLAGGCVRDLLLGVEAKDFDVATTARPEKIAGLFARTLGVGAHFGVMLVVEEADGERIATEVATFRNDGVYLDGRRPEAVRFSLEAHEDVARRDFTINGMLLDPVVGEVDPLDVSAGVLDFVGGREDLAAGVVRTIGPAERRFEEDKLRMLRGVRFAARLGFALEDETKAAMKRLAGEIGQVSAERIRDELTKMLTEGGARQAFELLQETGLLHQVLPEVERMRGVEQPPAFHPEGDVWVHTLMLLERLPAGASPTLAWGMLLHDVGKPATFQAPDPGKRGDRIRFNGHAEVGTRLAEEILRRLRFSNEDAAQILALVANHMRFGDVKAMRESTLRRFLRMPRFEEHLELHKADCESSHGRLELWEFARERFEAEEPAESRPKALLTGRDLLAAGYPASPQFKKMLGAAEDAQLEWRVTTLAEALALVAREFGPAPGESRV